MYMPVIQCLTTCSNNLFLSKRLLNYLLVNLLMIVIVAVIAFAVTLPGLELTVIWMGVVFYINYAFRDDSIYYHMASSKYRYITQFARVQYVFHIGTC